MTKQIDLSPLVVEDATLNVSTTINAAPRGVMFRELLRNGLEAPQAKGETQRLIKILQRRVPGYNPSKVAIINTGLGMDADTLKRTANLNATTKARKGILGTNNRGEGAKIGSLRFNAHGFSYMSRRDELLEVLLLKRNDVWGRHKEHIGDAYHEVWVPEISAEDRAAFPAGDFTMVTLLGNARNQNTLQDPYGTGTADPAAIPTEIFDRFYTFSDAEGVVLPTTVMFAGNQFGGDSELIPLKDMIAAAPTVYKSERVEIGDGVVVEFIHAETKGPMFASKLHAGGARCALVWHGEMYDVTTAAAWMRKAIDFGLMGLGKAVTVLVHLPDTYQGVHASKYRECLQYDGSRMGETVRCDDFQGAIYAARPEWLRKLNAIANPGASVRTTRQRLEEFRRQLLALPKGAGKTALKDGGRKAPEKSDAVDTETTDETANTAETEAQAAAKPAAKAAPKAPGRGAPSSKGKPIVATPEVSFQNGADDVPDLAARAVCYARSRNIIFVNVQSPQMVDFAEAVLAAVTTGKDGEVVALRTPELVDAVKDRVQQYVYEQVAKVVMRNLACQGHADWDSTEIDQSLAKEALHNVVLASMSYPGLLGRDIGNSVVGKAAKAAFQAQASKTARVRRAAADLSTTVVDLPLSTLKPSDLRGLPEGSAEAA